MTYVLYFAVSLLLLFLYAKAGIEELPDDVTMVILAILTSGEVISWRCRK